MKSKTKKTLFFVLLLSFVSVSASGQTVFSTEFEPDFVSYQNLEERKYQPAYTLLLKTEKYFTSVGLNFRDRGTRQNERLDTYYRLKGGSEVGNFGFRGKVLRAANEGVSDFTLFQVEAFKKSPRDLNVYPLYEYRYYEGFNKSLNNIGAVFTKRSELVFTKITLSYEFETESITPTVSHTFQFTPRHSFELTAASDNYYYALNPFGPSDFYSPFDEKYITGAWNTKIGDGSLELGVEGGYLDQPLFGDTYFFGANIHFNMISK